MTYFHAGVLTVLPGHVAGRRNGPFGIHYNVGLPVHSSFERVGGPNKQLGFHALYKLFVSDKAKIRGFEHRS
jgi:hypothetical protein